MNKENDKNETTNSIPQKNRLNYSQDTMRLMVYHYKTQQENTFRIKRTN